ncbi:DUF4136 domain-containing protein [Aurantiacibacter aquimixticola]|uniref:DUF4136 domain-containing protein n=1 Tax=Aurantiacibacter aquimixticola TaxID=1958945 RepID=A0A419RU38_9SPHN|nr:DUF4136 domain-containing protein [Aurantiacibacter aquimixticola]RJY09290.1 DUF4136 domain-containing protein [Aurantiacibacter aquimixticola]
MRKTAITLALASALLAGCATPAYVSPVEVTRFVGATPTALGQGTISVEPAPGLDGNTIVFGAYADAVRAQLQEEGYTVVAANGAQVAQIDIEAFVAQGEDRRGGVGVGGGASTGSYGSGVGVGVGVDLTRLLSGPSPERIERQLSVAIKPQAGGANLWEGRASMTATSNSDYAEEAAAASRLADGLFTGFPGVSGETIAVE